MSPYHYHSYPNATIVFYKNGVTDRCREQGELHQRVVRDNAIRGVPPYKPLTLIEVDACNSNNVALDADIRRVINAWQI